MPTSAEVRNRAAKKLGLLGTGQTLQSNISADLDDAVTEVYAELQALGLATWASGGTVPNELAHSVVSLVAGARVDDYAVPNDKYQRVKSDALQAENRIRSLVTNNKVGTTKIQNY